MFLGLPDPLDRGTEPRIRIRVNMPRIHTTECKVTVFKGKASLMCTNTQKITVRTSVSDTVLY
jgi:hypothetical protein